MVGVVLSWSVLNGEVVLLKHLNPFSHLTLLVTELWQPGERGMVDAKCEPGVEQLSPEMLHCQNHR